MMTEREAWLKLAEWCAMTWETPKTGAELVVRFGPLEDYAFGGLCAALRDLIWQVWLEVPVRRRMRDVLAKLRHEELAGTIRPAYKQAGYVWPLTKAGHEQRRQFCLAQAEKAEPAADQS